VVAEQVELMCNAAGIEVRVVEPRSEFDPAMVGVVFKNGQWMAAYNAIDLAEAMASSQPEWDDEDVSEWLAYNMDSLVALVD
tara:strand:+ start:190 stop:435 length:246 start_codon:yes stop_codon:yes gene_type:complete